VYRKGRKGKAVNREKKTEDDEKKFFLGGAFPARFRRKKNIEMGTSINITLGKNSVPREGLDHEVRMRVGGLQLEKLNVRGPVVARSTDRRFGKGM